ncbi:hypothetical protein [Pseudomonas sp. TH10]|uniref:hypothetical protein n=1 Tax=Pseudomonas sp. TH10 TaxID=2796376 RepID=UPI00191445F6|nr:hypothetical protein [Pseudomonas sp. TH10]MBK5517599.1 hypothetical protein [Pseudomonas sp. TH10]
MTQHIPDRGEWARMLTEPVDFSMADAGISEDLLRVSRFSRLIDVRAGRDRDAPYNAGIAIGMD